MEQLPGQKGDNSRIPEPTIQVMLSSVVHEMEGDREVVKKVIGAWPFFTIVGASPAQQTSHAKSSFVFTRELARTCDLYIIMLGPKYGQQQDGRSATEVEFDAAYSSDPTKILAFLKQSSESPEVKQGSFIRRVTDYTGGYWRSKYENGSELHDLVLNSCGHWIRERIGGLGFPPFDSFVINAIKMRPATHVPVECKVSDDSIEVRYFFCDREYTVFYNRDEIVKNYWAKLQSLESTLRERFSR